MTGLPWLRKWRGLWAAVCNEKAATVRNRRRRAAYLESLPFPTGAPGQPPAIAGTSPASGTFYSGSPTHINSDQFSRRSGGSPEGTLMLHVATQPKTRSRCPIAICNCVSERPDLSHLYSCCCASSLSGVSDPSTRVHPPWASNNSQSSWATTRLPRQRRSHWET